MKKALVDVAVLLIFFVRHEQFGKVFKQVQLARPSELFLYQDGPRKDYAEDWENIRKCREIAENIDWECKIHRLYQKENIGVDPSGYIAHTWAFSHTDKCIVLEDDIVPAVSFFSFCKEMLDKYEHDERIMLISGMNVEEKTDGIVSDYFFSVTTITWGWASWGRVVNHWDKNYRFLDDSQKRQEIQKYIDEKKLVKNTINSCLKDRESGIEHFETILIAYQYLKRGLTIVPKKNMINNIGVTKGAAHYASEMSLLPRGLRRIFTMPRYEMDLDNIAHPETIDDYEPYKESVYRIYAWGHPWKKVYRLFEVSFYQLKKGNFKAIKKDVMHKFKKFITKTNT